MSEERVDRLVPNVKRLLPPHSLKAAEPIGDGDFAVVYRGEMDGRAVAVKVLVDCPMRNHLKGFSEFVHDVADLTHPSVAPLYQAALDENPQFLVLEYVEAPCLGRHLRTVGRPFETDQVVSLVQGLALALDEYHRRRVVYGPLTANDVFYDQERNLLRISAVGLSNYLAVNDPISETTERWTSQKASRTSSCRLFVIADYFLVCHRWLRAQPSPGARGALGKAGNASERRPCTGLMIRERTADTAMHTYD